MFSKIPVFAKHRLGFIVVPVLAIFWFFIGTTSHRTLWLARIGNREAMFQLAVGYLTGHNPAPEYDSKKGYTWLIKACEKGHTGAMFLYFQGNQIRVSDSDVGKWLKKGAELGNEGCMMELSSAYAKGNYGLSQNIGACIYWSLAMSRKQIEDSGFTGIELENQLEEYEKTQRMIFGYNGPISPLP